MNHVQPNDVRDSRVPAPLSPDLLWTYDLVEEQHCYDELSGWLSRFRGEMTIEARHWRAILPRLLHDRGGSREATMALLRLSLERYPDAETRRAVQAEVVQRFWPIQKDHTFIWRYQALLRACGLGLVYERLIEPTRDVVVHCRSFHARSSLGVDVRYPAGGVWVKELVALLVRGEVGWALTLLRVFAEHRLVRRPLVWMFDRLCLDAMTRALRAHQYGAAAALGRWLCKRDADDAIMRRLGQEIVDRTARDKSPRDTLPDHTLFSPSEALAQPPGQVDLVEGLVTGLKVVTIIAEEEAHRRNQPIVLNLLSWDDEA